MTARHMLSVAHPPAVLLQKDSQSSDAAPACALGLNRIEDAIVRTVAYADVFDYPLTPAEIQRYLVAAPGTLTDVQTALSGARLQPLLRFGQGYVALHGRLHLVEVRQRRGDTAQQMLPKAFAYGRAIARLPFVRMVALTGALSMSNVDAGADMDYLIVTCVGRLWLCRALVIALVRLAARRGDTICPNYFISERDLVLAERNLHTAHELAQMIPIAGFETFRRMYQANDWLSSFLPNALMAAAAERDERPPAVRRLVERLLRTPVATWLENWEMARKIRKFAHKQSNQIEADFCADRCKGHFDAHGQRALADYAARLHTLL